LIGKRADGRFQQTTALRVSIHCEGCRKKVRKVLHGMEGVYTVTVDAAQHKVVVAGSLGADALVRRLNKAGKMARAVAGGRGGHRC
jgi:copper chaperone CopZ